MIGNLLQEASQNPWEFLEHLLTTLGAVLLLVGIAMGVCGQYLKFYSVKAKGDAAAGIVSVESVFGNVSFQASQSPYLSVTTSNVGNDITNLGNDAWRFLSNTANQAWADLSGIATAIGDIPKALVQLISQGPGIAINGLLGLVSEAVSDLLILIFPYAIIFGAVILAVGLGMYLIRYVYETVLYPELKAWASENIVQPASAWLHDALSLKKPSPPAPVAAPPTPPVTPPTSPSVVPAVVPGASGGKEGAQVPRPVVVAVPTETQEAQLGDALQTAKDRLRAHLRARDAPKPARKKKDLVGWAYARLGQATA